LQPQSTTDAERRSCIRKALSHPATIAKEVNSMIEVNFSYDLLQGIDQKAYGEWALKAVGAVLKSPGIIEFRANRNLLGSPQVR
jgi:hypothetical protein